MVSVALPVRNGAPHLEAVLHAVRAQRLDAPLEIVAIDSGSTDGSLEILRSHGVRIQEIAHSDFSHGGTRNALMELAGGEYVAFLTQDAEPVDDRWLTRLLEGFALSRDVGLTCGPYRPRPGASVPVRRELETWFASFTAGGNPRVDRSDNRSPHPGPATFFSSANGCVARAAWTRVPFRPVPYAEDQRLAVDMLHAGFAKVFLPEAEVWHSHEYAPLDGFRRVFDEFRALSEVYGHRESLAPRPVIGRIRREVSLDRRWARRAGTGGERLDVDTLRSLRYHSLRAVAAGVGTRAADLPPGLRRVLSLERRSTFLPTHLP